MCASIVGMLPIGVRDVFLQEAAVAEEELEHTLGARCVEDFAYEGKKVEHVDSVENLGHSTGLLSMVA